jgi:hypothetical protein
MHQPVNDPLPERPHAPGYEVPESSDGLLPFAWARRRLEDAITWWVASVRPDGRPHVMPIWGAWVDDRAYLLGQLTARWARNLGGNAACVVHIQAGEDVVIVEGEAVLLSDPSVELLERCRTGFAKYQASHGNAVAPEAWVGKGFWEVTPRVAFGFSDYVVDATRWRFPVPDEPADPGA